MHTQAFHVLAEWTRRLIDEADEESLKACTWPWIPFSVVLAELLHLHVVPVAVYLPISGMHEEQGLTADNFENQRKHLPKAWTDGSEWDDSLYAVSHKPGY